MTDELPMPTAPKIEITDEERKAHIAKAIEFHKGMTCNCCQRDKEQHPVIGVAASGMVAMSFAWCHECLLNGAEPEMVCHYMRDDVANGDKNALVPQIFEGLHTFKDGKYITFGEWWDTTPVLERK